MHISWYDGAKMYGDISEPFWMVYGVDRTAPTQRHKSPEKAQTEAERLAQKFPGERFYVLASIGCALVEKPAIYRAIDTETGQPF